MKKLLAILFIGANLFCNAQNCPVGYVYNGSTCITIGQQKTVDSLANIAIQKADSLFVVEKNKITSVANGSVGIMLTSLTQTQINSLFAVIWNSAGGVDSLGRVKKIW